MHNSLSSASSAAVYQGTPAERRVLCPWAWVHRGRACRRSEWRHARAWQGTIVSCPTHPTCKQQHTLYQPSILASRSCCRASMKSTNGAVASKGGAGSQLGNTIIVTVRHHSDTIAAIAPVTSWNNKLSVHPYASAIRCSHFASRAPSWASC